jgi:large subunit ribosomal protein L28
MTGHNVSHAHNLNKRRWLPNLQKIRVEIDGKAKKTYVCTQCIKGGAAKKVV